MKRPSFLAAITALAATALVPPPVRAGLRSPLPTTCAAEARARIEAWTGAVIGGEWRACGWTDNGPDRPGRIFVVTQVRGGHLVRFTFQATADGYRSRWERVIQVGRTTYVRAEAGRG